MKVIRTNGTTLEGSLKELIDEKENSIFQDKDLFLLINTQMIGGNSRILFGYYCCTVQEEKESWNDRNIYFKEPTPENKYNLIEVSRGIKLIVRDTNIQDPLSLNSGINDASFIIYDGLIPTVDYLTPRLHTMINLNGPHISYPSATILSNLHISTIGNRTPQHIVCADHLYIGAQIPNGLVEHGRADILQVLKLFGNKF